MVNYTKPTNLTNVLATNFPTYDIVFIIANTTYYGGAGGFAATFTLNASSNEIGVHELGHSFAGLSDEYYAGVIYEREALNMTRDKNPQTIRWKNWLNTLNIGIFDHAAPGQAWAKPSSNSCRMEFLNKQFCSVCREGFVEKILSLISPVESQLPSNNSVILSTAPTAFRLNLLKPEPNSLQIEWFLDGKSISGQEQIQLSAASLANPTAKLVAAVYDSTFFSRTTTRKLKPYTIEWDLARGNAELFQISADKSRICAGDSVVLTSKGCAGTVTWSNAQKGSTIIAKPPLTGSYSAICSIDSVSSVNTVTITVLPTPIAVATNQGPYFENQTIELMGAGGEKYVWKGPAGFTSELVNPVILNAKTVNAGIYTFTAYINSCQSTTSTTVVVTGFTATITGVSPQSLCPNTPFNVVFSTIGQAGTNNSFIIQLSDNQGNNFINLSTVTEGNTLKATLPSGTPAGADYKVRITSSNPSTVSTVSSTALTVKPLPTAAFETKDISIQQYTAADIKINLTGDAPWKVGLSDGKLYDAADSPTTISVAPNETTEYKISSVSNSCGLEPLRFQP